MAEVGTRPSMMSNHEMLRNYVSETSSTWHYCSVYSSYRVGPAITFYTVNTQMKYMNTQDNMHAIVMYIHVQLM